MPIWILEPVADPQDPRWQGRRRFDRVVVRAPSAAFARVLAEPLDTPERVLEFGEEDPRTGSGFKDEKLYRAIADADGDYPPEGPPGVLESVPASGG
ncbi:MAG: hypothetical protein EA406_01355 [Rhodospirillales bacterium]|nr:MAG: hypothetical protein EA406_01355 [Rhodospirillales bacterium]